jgi:tetratricopeptide (TPR) repeat protein
LACALEDFRKPRDDSHARFLMAASTHPVSATAPAASSSGGSGAPGSPWIWNPWLDLIIGCGGWSAPLLVVAFMATKTHTQQWAFAFYALALVFNYPHFMATIYRAYHTREQFEKYKIFTVHIAVLLGLAAIMTHAVPTLLPWLFTLYVCWSPWHYSGQNFGLMMMFSRRVGLAPQLLERRILYGTFIASYVLLMLNFHTGKSNDEMILSLGIPANVAIWPKAACAAFFLIGGGWVLTRFARRASSWRAMAAPAMLFFSQFLWFVLFVGLEIASRLEVQQTRYSTGILAVLHSTQYLWITSYYQRREARAEGQSNWRLTGYFATLIAGGIALFVPAPWIVSRLLHVDFSASFLTFTALVNIHHFILDGAIWKLRDKRVAALLVDTGDKAQSSVAEPAAARGGVMGAAYWLAGSSRGAGIVRVSAAVLLLAWGVMDQLRYYWMTVEARPLALARAAKLNPYDSTLLGHIARADQRAGDAPDALTTLIRAVQLNPHSRSLRHQLAHALLSAGRYAEADRVYQDLLTGYPDDMEALVNDGLLAQRMGRRDEAMDHWRHAVEVDPTQGNAQLYLGDALGARGEDQAAATHYRAYLQLVADHPEKHVGESRLQLAALIKIADADERARRTGDAALGYAAAAAMAKKENDALMESLASVHHAELEAALGHAPAAAQLFQRALTLDAGLKDDKGVAADWVEYAQFLRRNGLPERLAFACFLHAEQLLRNSPGDEQETVTKLRAASEASLGHEAAAVRGQAEQVLKETLALPPDAFVRR